MMIRIGYSEIKKISALLFEFMDDRQRANIVNDLGKYFVELGVDRSDEIKTLIERYDRDCKDNFNYSYPSELASVAVTSMIMYHYDANNRIKTFNKLLTIIDASRSQV